MSKIGVDNLHFYPLLKDDESGMSYGAGVAIPGTVSIDISPSTNNATLYADNGAWETANTMGEVSVTIELADIPKHIQAALLGHTIDSASGRLISKSTDESPYVGISFAALKALPSFAENFTLTFGSSIRNSPSGSCGSLIWMSFVSLASSCGSRPPCRARRQGISVRHTSADSCPR